MRATIKRNGYRVTVYDRAGKEENKRRIESGKASIEIYPLRFEIRLVRENSAKP